MAVERNGHVLPSVTTAFLFSSMILVASSRLEIHLYYLSSGSLRAGEKVARGKLVKCPTRVRAFMCSLNADGRFFSGIRRSSIARSRAFKMNLLSRVRRRVSSLCFRTIRILFLNFTHSRLQIARTHSSRIVLALRSYLPFDVSKEVCLKKTKIYL